MNSTLQAESCICSSVVHHTVSVCVKARETSSVEVSYPAWSLNRKPVIIQVIKIIFDLKYVAIGNLYSTLDQNL